MKKPHLCLILCIQVLELEANEVAGYDIENDENRTEIQEESTAAWNVIFREQRQQIIEFWDVCHVSIIHRTQFYLLFKGDPADQIYMEVELRRLTWLQQHLAELGNASPARFGDEPTISLASRLIYCLLRLLSEICICFAISKQLFYKHRNSARKMKLMVLTTLARTMPKI